MCSENGTFLTERLLYQYKLLVFIRISERFYSTFLGEKTSHDFLHRAALETWLDCKEPTSSTQLSARTEALVKGPFQKGIGAFKNKNFKEECAA